MSVEEFAAGWEVVIGLEVHAQLLTRTKLFSPMAATFGEAPNTRVNEICAGLPGVLPVLNREAVTFAIRAGLALGCRINGYSRFARKNYFYPDLPKGYQISQFEHPLCSRGELCFPALDREIRCRIERIHLEEDAGKLIHGTDAPVSYVDLNRAGVPLLEIVSEPDLRHPEEAVGYLKELRNVLMYIGVCDGNMEEGSLRCDANVSVRRRGETELGTKVELKNMNSFKFLKDALTYEAKRQIGSLEAGAAIVQETRLWRTDSRKTVTMRRKEGSDDYRYFPDPDLPPLIVEDAWIDEVRRTLVELPAAKRRRYREALGLTVLDAAVITASQKLATYFEEAAAQHDNAKGIANWLMTEVLGAIPNEEALDRFAVRPAHLAELVALIDSGDITGTIAKKVFAEMVETGERPGDVVDRKNLRVVRDTDRLQSLVEETLADHPAQVEEYRAGKTKLLGFFVGQIMRATRGKADPKLVNRLLAEKLGESS